MKIIWYSLQKSKYPLYVFSSSSSNHELLLNVLWEGVVHTSAQVRATAARMFEVCIKLGIHIDHQMKEIGLHIRGNSEFR